MRPLRAGLLTICVLGLVGCTEPTTSSTPSPEITPTPTSTATPTPTPRTTPDPWQQGLDTAMGAATFAQSAQSESDWELVASQWQRAIDLLKTVPETHPQRVKAQQKIAEYQQNLAIAQQHAERAANPSTPIPRVSQQASQTSSTPSIPPKLALARHLKAIGAKVYETYWCPACRRQQELFGASAYREITRIECDPRGENAQPQRCARARIQAYPTWEINGRLYRGGYSLDSLADLSGYEGSRNF